MFQGTPVYDGQRELKGFEQVAVLTSAVALTVPAGTTFAIITVTGQIVRWRSDGTSPTTTVGMPMTVNTEYRYFGSDLATMEFIETTATAVLNVSYYA